MAQNPWSKPEKTTTTTTMWLPSSSSSTPHKAPVHTGLTRFSSAPGAFLARAVDSVIGPEREFSALGSPSPSPSIVNHQYFSSDSSSFTSESNCKVNSSIDPRAPPKICSSDGGLQRSYGFSEINGSLLRQKSSPAGFLSNVVTENGFSITNGTVRYNSHSGLNSGHGVSRLKSQLSFTGQDSLSQISELSEDIVEGINSNNGHRNSSHSYSTLGFGVGSWDNTNSIVFSGPPSKRAKNIDGDFFNCLNGLETQFSLPTTSVEMERLLNIPEDSVPCKIRAKRGYATHPRSIAERERRTRISRRLKKLQELVPNMDKQTSYSDMLDLAVQHIKGLQGEVQKLHNELEKCMCGCKPST